MHLPLGTLLTTIRVTRALASLVFRPRLLASATDAVSAYPRWKLDTKNICSGKTDLLKEQGLIAPLLVARCHRPIMTSSTGTKYVVRLLRVARLLRDDKDASTKPWLGLFPR